MRCLYTCLLYLATPFFFLRLWWRGKRLPAYRKRWGERLGCYPFKLSSAIWLHAVSVGEVVAAAPIIRALLEKYPQYPLLVTTMTPTGSARVQALFGDQIKHVYLPYDLPHAIQQFLRAMNPIIGIIFETELWPNLLHVCAQQKIPMYLLNARLSAKSARGYQRIASLTRNMLRQFKNIAAQHVDDAERLIALGAAKDSVMVTGNIKFDLSIPDGLNRQANELRQSFGKRKLIWIAASTHQGEEEIILSAHEKIRHRYDDALLILVPRHPDRFNQVTDLCKQKFATVRRTEFANSSSSFAVYVGDTMGELLLLYAVADIVFVGGSLMPHGGHNLLEPCVLGKPVLTGPHVFNFSEISQILFSNHALMEVNNAEALAHQVIYLFEHTDIAARMGRDALQVIEQNRGALQRQLKIICNCVQS